MRLNFQRDDSVHQHSHTSPGQERSRNHFMTRASISIALESAANGTIELYDENGRSQLVNIHWYKY